MNYPEKYSFQNLNAAAYKDMLPEMIRQLKKDFEMTGLRFELGSGAAAEQLVQYLSGRVHELILNDYGTYAALMYRIDVPEQRIASVNTGKLDELIENITQFILEKEWQKVWFRIRSKN